MENPQGINAEPLKSPVRPIIEYDPSLQKEDVPYSVRVDGEKCAELLRELGVKQDDINNTTIHLSPKAKEEWIWGIGAAGKYDEKTNAIHIYTDNLWEIYGRYLMKADILASGVENPRLDTSFKGFLSTKRLSKYLKNAPRERGLEFAKKLIIKSTSKKGADVLVHESSHAADNSKSPKKTLLTGIALGFARHGFGAFIGSGVGLALSRYSDVGNIVSVGGAVTIYIAGTIFSVPLFYFLNPNEIRARKIEKKYKNSPIFRDLITFVPKEVLPQSQGVPSSKV